MNKRNQIILIIVGLALLLLAGALYAAQKNKNRENTQQENIEQKPGEDIFCAQVITPARNKATGETKEFPNACLPEGWERIEFNSGFSWPISRAEDRPQLITFGQYISRENSPLPEPERFAGYHTGLDFEIFPDELNKDVVVIAACDGNVIYNGTADGYGGVVVQQCQLNGETVTVLYGHLRSSSVDKGKKLYSSGERIGLLGDDHSQETSDTRKHLHLHIHKGARVELRGYVSDPNQLSEYIDPKTVMN